MNDIKYYTVKESGANLSRLLQHLKENDVAFITAYRGKLSHKENIRRNKQLALDAHNAGYSYIKVTGNYIEDETGVPKEEATYAIIHKPESKEDQDEFFNEMLGLCAKWNQDAVLISLANRPDVPPASYASDGSIVYGPFTKLTQNDVEAFSTQIHGHKFKFESFMESEEGIKPDSFSNAMRYYGTRAALKTLSRK